ncbi:MAG TPA: iron ABC transporter permease [Polyangiales bacterium]|nr:iron ABC transporter permease [Polyangiales bacterium]
MTSDALELSRPGQGWTRGTLISVALVLFALASAMLGLWVGRGTALDGSMRELFMTLRAYRIGVAFFAGGALAVSGAVVQGLVRNPLASPNILGTNAGALLGGKLSLIVTFIVLDGRVFTGVVPEMLMPLGCIVGACVALFTVLSVSSLRASTISLVLTGFVMNGIFLSIGSFLSNASMDYVELNRAMTTFQAGSLSGSGSRQLLLAITLSMAGLLPALFWSRSLDVLLSGEEEAAALGVEVPRVRFWCVLWAALMSAGAVSVGAGVGFIDLITPHVVRRFVGPSHRYLLPASFVLGGSFLILCDALCRAIPFKHEVPLQVLVDMLGGPAFLWMLRRLGTERGHG